MPGIGLNLKILVDKYSHAAIIATGSASFDLATQVAEPLTGRSLTFTLYPVSYQRTAPDPRRVRGQTPTGSMADLGWIPDNSDDRTGRFPRAIPRRVGRRLPIPGHLAA